VNSLPALPGSPADPRPSLAPVTELGGPRVDPTPVHLARHDRLTGLPTRRLLLDSIEVAQQAQQPTSRQVGALFIDLDGFGSINDTYGDGVGDELLVTMAKRMSRCIRGSDLLARIGGDEFAVLLCDLMDDDAPIKAAERIARAVREPYELAAAVVTITASIGIAVSTSDSPRRLLHLADLAMYEAKLIGPGRIAVNTG
jgi:diguanylate cyclase (GGDEF)-like protein